MQDLHEDLKNTQFRHQERWPGAMSCADGLRMMQGMMSERWPADVEDTLRAHGIPLPEPRARNWADVGNGQVYPVETVRPWSEVTTHLRICLLSLPCSIWFHTHACHCFPCSALHWLADHIHTRCQL